MASGSGRNLWVWLAGAAACGWNLWVWLVGVVVRRYSRNSLIRTPHIRPPNPTDYIIRILVNAHRTARRTTQLVCRWYYVRTYVALAVAILASYVQYRQKEACCPFLRLKCSYFR